MSVVIQLVMYIVLTVRLGWLKYVPGAYFAAHRLSYLVACRRSIVAFSSFIVWFRILKCAPRLCTLCPCSSLNLVSPPPRSAPSLLLPPSTSS